MHVGLASLFHLHPSESSQLTPTALYALPHAPQGGHKGTAGRVSGEAIHAKEKCRSPGCNPSK